MASSPLPSLPCREFEEAPLPPYGASSLPQPLVRNASSYARSQLVKIVLQHFHDELLVAGMTPAIAVDAALALSWLERPLSLRLWKRPSALPNIMLRGQDRRNAAYFLDAPLAASSVPGSHPASLNAFQNTSNISVLTTSEEIGNGNGHSRLCQSE
jgi:hypothetical protein